MESELNKLGDLEGSQKDFHFEHLIALGSATDNACFPLVH